MAATFSICRVAPQRLFILFGDFRTELIESKPEQIPLVLSLLNLKSTDAKLQKQLQQALDAFYVREQRAVAKFGPDKTFRIWRLDSKTLQIDFKGGHAELSSSASSDPILKRCLNELGANEFLLSDLKRELKEFLKNERPEPLSNVIFFRDAGTLKLLVDSDIHDLKGETDAAILQLARKLKSLEPDRLLITYHLFQDGEKRIAAALGRQAISSPRH